jgi:hypothetical protein
VRMEAPQRATHLVHETEPAKAKSGVPELRWVSRWGDWRHVTASRLWGELEREVALAKVKERVATAGGGACGLAAPGARGLRWAA